MVLGVALGVAVVVAVDLANASAGRAFDLSVDAVAGRATHQVVAGPQGLDEAVYAALRRDGEVQLAAPVLEGSAVSPQLGGRTLRLLGIDPFAEPPFRSYLGAEDGLPLDQLVDFLTRPGAVLLSVDLASQYGLEAGAPLTLQVGGYERQAFVAGLLQPADGLSRRALEDILLADIATVQELTGRLGRIDRIDLILPQNGAAEVERIAALLPPGARIDAVAARSGAVREMTVAFRTNLLALSLLALMVGMFLIYNTMTFAVVQRRELFGTLRCLGVTRREIFALVLGEALVVGLLGSASGMLLGVLMGRSAVRLVAQTINDLYFAVSVHSVAVPVISLVKGGLLGVLATVTAAGLPAWEAASVPPRSALSRSLLEAKARRATTRVALGGLLLLALGALILAIPTRSLAVSFGGICAVVLGFALLTPLATRWVMRGAAPPLGRLAGPLGRLAPRGVANSLSRTAIAVAALMVAMAVVIGIQLMISSFRHTVVAWLSYALQADVYIAASEMTGSSPMAPVDPAVLDVVARRSDVAVIDLIRAVNVDSPYGPVYLEAGNSADYGDHLLYLAVDGSPQEAWAAVRDGEAVIVSEPLAHRIDLPRHGGTIQLYTDRGPRTFPVSAIYHDYATPNGAVIMGLDTYRRFWDDAAFTAVALELEAGTDPGAVVQSLRETLPPTQRLVVQPNRALREEALRIFDRTFAITAALQLLATAVAFIGVLSALLSLLLEKRRELGILRSVGLTARQLWRLVMLETGLMGMVAGLLSMPAGWVLALILIYTINLRSFGWTLQFRLEAAPFLQALAIAVAAGLLAGIYPAYRMGRIEVIEALRYER
ncbi:MAG: ABC transporter permease [Anaerolineae bacterium]|nr:ABC transporter permease [Anaerolineae bacterium]